MSPSIPNPNPLSSRTISWFGGRDIESDDPHLIAAEDLLRMRDGTKSPNPHLGRSTVSSSSNSITSGYNNNSSGGLGLGSPLSMSHIASYSGSNSNQTFNQFPNPTPLSSGVITSSQLSPKTGESLSNNINEPTGPALAVAMPSEPNFSHFRNNNNNNKSMRQNSSMSLFSLNSELIENMFSRNNSIELSFMANGNLSQGHQSDLFAKLYESTDNNKPK